LATDPRENSLPAGTPPGPALLGSDHGGVDPSATVPSASLQSFSVGDIVELAAAPRYLKSADPMPMLRPPDLVDGGELGRVTEIRPLDQLAVRFRRGTFLIAAADLRPGSAPG